MSPDSALARLARGVLTAAAALLAAVTPLTHLAQASGLSFRVYAVAVVGIAVVGAALCWKRMRRGDRPDVELRAVVGLMAVCALAAVVPVVVQHATADDAVYLPSVVHSLAYPADAMGFDVRYAWFGAAPVVSPHWNVATPFDYLEGVLAYVTGVPLLTVRYLVVPPLTAALFPLAVFYLLTRFGFRDTPALAGCLLLGAALLLMRETERTPGTIALLLPFQGKFVAHAVGASLYAAFAIDLARAPRRGTWARLFAVATAVAGCGASSVVLLGLLAPLLLVAGVLAFAGDRLQAVRTSASTGAALVYPAFVAVWALAASSGSFRGESPVHRLYSPDFGPNAAWVFAGPATIGLLLVASGLALWGLGRRERRFVVAWTLGAGVLVLNPLVAPLVIEHITTPNLYWRAFYVAPLISVLALAAAGVADRLERSGARRAVWGLGALLAALVLLQIPAQLGGLYGRTQLVRPFPDPDRCLNRIVAAQARYVARTAPPGPMLAPPYLSRIVPLVGAGHPQLMHQEESIRLWAPDEVDLRFAASSFVGGGAEGSLDDVAALLRAHPEIVAVAAFPPAVAHPGLGALLRAAGFRTAADTGPDVVLFVRRP